jgi:hypothetical protein
LNLKILVLICNELEGQLYIGMSQYSHLISARTREIEIKGWRREKKLKLILAESSDWADLSLEWQEDTGWRIEPDARPKLKRCVAKP